MPFFCAQCCRRIRNRHEKQHKLWHSSNDTTTVDLHNLETNQYQRKKARTEHDTQAGSYTERNSQQENSDGEPGSDGGYDFGDSDGLGANYSDNQMSDSCEALPPLDAKNTEIHKIFREENLTNSSIRRLVQ
ncbi:uncharacterized protein ATC70_009965 [Mucor velutinosus]|uniref:Uncharacterized protein n=1 Tax=Mucor velutinosus TaxID=708070 RepID=A0AAN7DMV6_9FUNG|nr:hypothetical protein ATC70_001371 [Mucor velutinosus]KAK4518456.1 hypothetical protein ATC70_008674 [Mucor velutinosus]KAK4519413.1 hypothetical protein ATC70_009648 [Mucor velutinosus]KAK4519725.1 hypothetical protein ATC70_009965 [Mucor velutinosus]